MNWIEDFRARLVASRYFGDAVINEIVAELQAHCAESGESLEEAFGSPEQYFQQTVEERVPEDIRAQSDKDGLSTRDHASLGIAVLGLVLAVHSLVDLLIGEGVVRVTVAGLAGVVALILAGAGLTAASALRVAGRPRQATGVVVSAPVLLVAGIAAFTQLPKTLLAEVGSAVGVAAGAALIGWGFFSFASRKRGDCGRTSESTDRWLSDLRGFLEGRHDVPPRDAARLVEETASYLRNSGNDPHAEFGPAQQFAMRLARDSKSRKPLWQRPEVQTAVFAGIALVAFLVRVQAAVDWVAWTQLFIAVVLGATGAMTWRANLRRT